MYTITDANFDSSNVLNKLTLLSGDVILWLTQDVKVTRVVDGVEHDIFVVDVSENEDRCGINVDGTTVWIDVDATETVNGIEIGVTDAVSVHTATQDTDVCELSIGANELILEEGQEIEQSGVTIDSSEARFLGSAGSWEGLNITMALEDEMWLAPGQSWTDPIFGSIGLRFANEVYDEEEIKFDASSTSATLKFDNTDGDEVEIKWSLDKDTDTVYLGWDTEKDHLLTEDNDGGSIAAVRDCDTTSSRYDD
jgi:hypothetical protein